jgi:YebC/PmpR family DNA-binding regulatory protein
MRLHLKERQKQTRKLLRTSDNKNWPSWPVFISGGFIDHDKYVTFNDMSGHSKWASIKHKKGAADAKRGKTFSKLAKVIMLSAKMGGGDPSTNFSLRLAIDKARSANMPKDNIERAIKRGTGEGSESIQLETALYEVMGPGGSAILVQALTDNKNRTYGNLRTIVNKRGGNIEGKVLWMFNHKGVARVDDFSSLGDADVLELELIEAGADDILFSDEGLVVISEVKELKNIVDVLTGAALIVSSADLEYIAKDELQLSDEQLEKLAGFVEAVEEDDDVDVVFTNVV